jgi:uncharacterized membrane protein
MLFLRILHVIGNIAWLGGGALAAFAMAMLASEADATRLAAARALRKLVLWLVTPGMLLSLAAGLILLLDQWSTLYAKQPWMHGKLTVGLIAAAFSGVLSGRLRRGTSDATALSPKAFRLAGSVLLLSALANVTLVIMRFGAR